MTRHTREAIFGNGYILVAPITKYTSDLFH